MLHLRWNALGTTAVLSVPRAHAIAARHAVRTEIAAIDAAASRFRPDSELMRLSGKPNHQVAISPLLCEALSLAVAAARETDGAVDPTLGAELVALGYDRDFMAMAQAPADAPPAPALPEARRQPRWHEITVAIDPPSVRIPDGVTLDLGATAKALAADRAARAAYRATGVGVLVSLGGDIATCGPPPAGGWPVRVTDDHRDPTRSGQLVHIAGGGLATSSVTTRRWSHAGAVRHHILDPRTGEPVDGRWRTVSVLAATCAAANTASTAAIVLDGEAPAWLSDHGLAARLVSHSGDMHVLGGWPA
jgi:thiamine biosynthesis lipoprotein